MIWLKRLAIGLLVYVGVVVAFETLIGIFQPQSEDTMIVKSAADNGAAMNRVLTRLEHDGGVYAAVNHWPRAWYSQVLEQPDVTIEYNGELAAYRAVDVTDTDEFNAVQGAWPLPVAVKVLTGFPARRFVRFDPV